MNSPKYKDWVESIKEGDLVLLMENSTWSAPVLFLAWNGDSSSSGYRSQHLYIPDWNKDHYWHRSEKDPEAAVNKQWESTYDELEKHGAKSRCFAISVVNANAEKRYFPFPKEFLTKNQKKFVKLINKIKGYEY